MRQLQPGEFFGESKSTAIADALLSEVSYSSARTLEHHSHLSAHFNLLLKGSYSESIGNLNVTYDPLSLVFNGPLTEHSEVLGSGGIRYFMIELGNLWADPIGSVRNARHHYFDFHGGEACWLALRLYKIFRVAAPDSSFILESLLFELCSCLRPTNVSQSREPRWLRKVLREVRERFNQKLELRALAGQAGVSPSHLARTFHRQYGRTIGDYVAGLRVQYVGRRVVESNEGLKNIALDAGFADQSHMTRMFKETTGIAPAEYRNLLRAGSFVSFPRSA